jgi:hypothetical protein
LLKTLPCLALAALTLAGSAVAAGPYHPPAATEDSYDAKLEAMVDSMAGPLINVMTSSQKSKISVAVAQFRELQSGQRSPFCRRLEHDVAAKMRSAMVFGIPGEEKVKKALKSLEGDNSDLSQADSLRDFSKMLDCQALVTGGYFIQGDRVLLQAQILRSEDGSKIWGDSQSFPVSELKIHEADLVPATQPKGYAPPPDLPHADAAQDLSLSAQGLPAPAGASPSAESDANAVAGNLLQAQAKLALERDAQFSWQRVSLGLGYKGFRPQNPTFRGVSGWDNGGYIKLSWADVVNGEFDYWLLPSTHLADISNLTAYGFTLSGTCPLRLGPYALIYAGLGGRIESIGVSATNVPSQYGIAYGNNSLLCLAGVKGHWGPYGAELGTSYDFLANYSGYLTLKLGLYYEYSFIN